jgi:hypothetical protein
LADRLLGIEKLVDVGLGEADRLGQVRNRGLAIAVAAEMRLCRVDDLVSDAVLDRPALAVC